MDSVDVSSQGREAPCSDLNSVILCRRSVQTLYGYAVGVYHIPNGPSIQNQRERLGAPACIFARAPLRYDLVGTDPDKYRIAGPAIRSASAESEGILYIFIYERRP